MRIPFSERPGRHERHYRRKLHNGLLPGLPPSFSEADLLAVQRKDHEELIGFLAGLRALVHRAVDLSPKEESQTVLDLKADLDRAYEEASRFADEQSGNKEAIRTLTTVIMGTVRAAAGNDGVATAELDAEDEARRLHYRLLEQPLVADLLDPDSLIGPEELTATLLGESEPGLRAALQLFDAEQLTHLCRDAAQLLRDPERTAPPEAAARFALMEEALRGFLAAHRPMDAGRG